MLTPEARLAISKALMACKSNEDLTEAFTLYKSRSKVVRAKAAAKVADSLCVGQTVKFKGRRGVIEKGTVTKINQTTATVKTAVTSWRVSLSALTICK